MEYFSINHLFEILTIIGFSLFLIRRFILKKTPLPASAFQKIDRERLLECLNRLKSQKQRPGESYQIPEELSRRLAENLRDPELLGELLSSIASHVGIDAAFIRLRFQDDETAGYAGNISTNGAWTTIRIQLHSYYNLDVITAVLAHEVMHLYLLYQGIHFNDTLSNEVLTDTAAVYFGFGDYLYRGYQVIETKLGFSYHKVGYIRPEDVVFIKQQL